MTVENRGEVTVLIERSQNGDPEALERLYRAVEAELRRLAHGRLAGLRQHLRGQGVEPSQRTTELLDDAFLNLVGDDKNFANRAHFVAIAAHRMRSLCRDYAERALARKRGRRHTHLALDDVLDLSIAPELPPEDFLAIDQALERLAALDPRQARVVELKFCAGLSDEETAQVLDISLSTVRREWRSARAFLHGELAPASRSGR